MACANLVVRVKQGQLRGVVADDAYGGQFLAFRGIPFAKPPVGLLRFKDPEPPEPWTGIRDASKFGDECAQINVVTRELLGSDDCLYLNVYRPVDDSPKRAVMVWIHGGAYAFGSGNDNYYGPDYLIRKDIVLVTINYRVGIFGFLNLEHELAPGNQGLKDQVMALRWVQENISNFGGDANNVTIFGESAGAASVHFLCLSPMAQGLFHKAISQSGIGLNPWAITSIEPKKYAFQVAEHLGEDSTDPETVLEFLRSFESDKLVKAEAQILTGDLRFVTFGLFSPGVDDKSPNPVLPQHPSILMQQSGIKVPYIVGYNTNEGGFLLNVAVYRRNALSNFKRINEKFEIFIHPEIGACMQKDGITSNDVKRIYFGDKPISWEVLPQCIDFVTDAFFLKGVYKFLDAQLEHGTQPTYFYQFTYDTEDSFLKRSSSYPLLGPTHTDELEFMFYSYWRKELGLPPVQPGTEKYRVMQYFTQMWTDFAKTGNPTPKATDVVPTIWKPLEKNDGYTFLNINQKLQMEVTDESHLRFDWKRTKSKI